MSTRSINIADYPIGHPPVLAWLRANGLDTAWLAYDQVVLIEDDKLTATKFIPSDDASKRKIKIGHDGEPVMETVTVPLISSPAAHNLFF